jgi:hypothetical protein
LKLFYIIQHDDLHLHLFFPANSVISILFKTE